MKIERSWKGQNKTGTSDPWKEIDEDRASRDLAKEHGSSAVEKLKKEGTLQTRFGNYRIAE